MTEALQPGATIGILGAGQLGRMLAMAAARLGFHVHAYDPAPGSPAGETAARLTTAAWDDADALDAFAASADVVTYEFENVPVASLDRIEAAAPIRPGRRSLAVSQDRFDEKTFLAGIGLRTAPFAHVNNAGELAAALVQIGTPSILKTRRLGYDGKGQARLMSPADSARALAAMGGQPAILEGFVPFDREISVIVARGANGDVEAFDPGENVHADGILRTTRVPAAIPPKMRAEAVEIARKIVEALDYVGVMGVELFVAGDDLLVNEIAPRVHNSGHWTEAGAVVDQFEQHIRAVAGLPLAEPVRHSDVEMTNLIGSDVARVPDLLLDPHVKLHLYGKAEVREGRKMGHATRVTGPA